MNAHYTKENPMDTENKPHYQSNHEHNDINIRCIRHFDELNGYRHDWDKLLENSVFHSNFQTYASHKAWWDSFGQDYELLTLIVINQDEVIGIAPLMRKTYKFNWLPKKINAIKSLYFIGTPDGADDCDFIIHKDYHFILESMVQWFDHHPDEWDHLSLYNLTSQSSHHEQLDTLFQHHAIYRIKEVLDTKPIQAQSLEQNYQLTAFRQEKLFKAYTYYQKVKLAYAEMCNKLSKP